MMEARWRHGGLWTISSITARAALQPSPAQLSPALQQLHVDLQLCPRLLLVQPALVLQISVPLLAGCGQDK